MSRHLLSARNFSLRSFNLRTVSLRTVSLLGAALVAASLAAISVAPAKAQEQPRRLTVVELYTSLACATCPPADEVLAQLSGKDDVLALSFHVDYWNYAGYRDPYSDIAFTNRQERYIERFGINYMLTPQVFVDGVLEGIGNDYTSMETLLAEAVQSRVDNVDISLSRTAEREVRVTLPRMDYEGQAEVLLVRFDAVKQTNVTGGEHAGKRLTNVNVVRQVVIHSLWKGDPISFDVPIEDLGDDDLHYYAVILQEPNQGHILGARYIDLRET
jgi:hypothetical protein